MRFELLEILNCPFCGSQLRLQQASILEMQENEIFHGILICHCCAYPIVSGIPYIRTGKIAEQAMDFLGKGNKEQALFTLLGLDNARQNQFQELFTDKQEVTFRRALEILCGDSEALYLFYRFSDPTFLTGTAVLEAVEQNPECFEKFILDLCGGTGHFTRLLCNSTDAKKVILADVSFWKIWLAKQFIAPGCQAVCCNANEPLPFAKEMFSLVFCSDAFHYIWSKRLLAGEILRLTGSDGTAVLAHLHNSLCYNPSAGMPLAPSGYKNLFDVPGVRLFKEDEILNAFLNKKPIDLSGDLNEEELSNTPTLLLITSQRTNLFQLYEKPQKKKVLGQLAVNPLYNLESSGKKNVLQLRFPSDYYEMEFNDGLRYLPETVELNDEQLEKIEKGEIEPPLMKLVENFVLLDAPPAYI
jgi:uncharacterized protein YbaR (Trm112 family)/SAM-dependent methyltransferase